MFEITVWVLFSALVAFYSQSKGYSFGMTFLCSVIFSPLLAFLVVMCFTNKVKDAQKEAAKQDRAEETELNNSLKEQFIMMYTQHEKLFAEMSTLVDTFGRLSNNERVNNTLLKSQLETMTQLLSVTRR